MSALIETQPYGLVVRYYEYVGSGDLGRLRGIMTEESYRMALSSFSLALTIRDSAFSDDYEASDTDPVALARVEARVSLELARSARHPLIEIKEIKPNGALRTTVHYLENGKSKKLYFSLENDGWRINYLAGRKVDE